MTIFELRKTDMTNNRVNTELYFTHEDAAKEMENKVSFQILDEILDAIEWHDKTEVINTKQGGTVIIVYQLFEKKVH